MYVPRLTKAGMLNNPYWYSSEYNFYGTDLLLPNCTCYCLGRLSEIANKNCKKEAFPNGIPNAKSWIDYCAWEHGDKPKLGAIAVWGGNYGHVATVEMIHSNGSITVSQSNYQAKKDYNSDNYFQTRIYSPVVGKNTAGVGLKFLGYIYNPYAEGEDMLVKFKKDPAYMYVWSVDGNKYGTDYDVTTYKGFADEKLEKDGWQLCLKVNGSLFYTYNSEHFACGLEKSRGINNQSVEMTAVSDYNSCMAIAGYEEDLYFGSQKWIINNVLNKAYCAITGLGLLLSGSKRGDMHKGFETQWNQVSGRTVIGEDEKGNFLSYSFPGETGKSGMTCLELQNKCLELGFVNAICLDGGGSVFRGYLNDQDQFVYDITTTRKVKNAVLLYRKKRDTNNDVPSDELKDLEQKYEDLKHAYNTLLDTNEELKNKLDSKDYDFSQLKEDYLRIQDELKEKKETLEKVQEKLSKIKEIIDV